MGESLLCSRVIADVNDIIELPRLAQNGLGLRESIGRCRLPFAKQDWLAVQTPERRELQRRQRACPFS